MVQDPINWDALFPIWQFANTYELTQAAQLYDKAPDMLCLLIDSLETGKGLPALKEEGNELSLDIIVAVRRDAEREYKRRPWGKLPTLSF